jgi:hypothetical protein
MGSAALAQDSIWPSLGVIIRPEPIIPQTVTVDPSGLSAGSCSSITAAIAALTTLSGGAGGVVLVPPGATITENVTFPNGGNWELRCDGLLNGQLTGNITFATGAAQTVYKVTNMRVTGTVTGAASNAGGNFFYCTCSTISGAVTLTQQAATSGFWWVNIQGNAVANTFVFAGGISGATSVFGAIFASQWTFAGAITAGQLILNSCVLPSSFTLDSSGTRGVTLTDCIFAGGVNTFTGSGGTATIDVDAATYRNMMFRGVDLVSATLQTNKSQLSYINAALVANVGAGNLNGGANSLHSPAGLYRAMSCMFLTAQGTAGTAVPNIIYTDRGGTLRTLPIATGLLVTAAVGTEDRGNGICFQHNGTTALQSSVTGITTPGAVSINTTITCERVD